MRTGRLRERTEPAARLTDTGLLRHSAYIDCNRLDAPDGSCIQLGNPADGKALGSTPVCRAPGST